MSLQLKINNVDIKELNDLIDGILITTSEQKKKILRESFFKKELLHFKIMNTNDFKSYLNLDLKDGVEYYIYKLLGNYHLAKLVYKNIIYLVKVYFEICSKNMENSNINNMNNSNINIANNDEKYNMLEDNENCALLLKVIRELDNNNFLNEYEMINEKVYVLDENIKYMYDEIVNVGVEINSNIKLKVDQFLDSTDEVFDVLNKVSMLIDNGINISDIKIYCNNKYERLLNVLSNYYDFSINLDSSYKISNKEVSDIVGKFTQGSLDEYLIGKSYAKDVYSILNENLEYIKEKEFINFFKSKIQELTIVDNKLTDVIDVRRIGDFDMNDRCYNFILGFNNYDFLTYAKDDDFIKDNIKLKLGIETSIDKNNNLKDKLKSILSYIQNTNNSYISFSTNFMGESVDINDSLEEVKYSITKREFVDKRIRYSCESDIYKFKYYLEKEKKENKIYPEVLKLKTTVSKFSDINVDFKPKGDLEWNRSEFKENKNISATLMDKYYKCKFLFYVENILGIKRISTNRLQIDIGVYIHHILEKIVDGNIVEKYVDSSKIIDEKSLREDIVEESKKFVDQEFLNYNVYRNFIIFKMNNYLHELIISIIEQVSSENFKIYLSEVNIETTFKEYKLKGKIDSVLKMDDYYMVLDYKTGQTSMNLDNKYLEYGLNLQNLIYFILLNSKIENVNFAGTYRYKVSPKISDENKASLREGYTIDKSDIIANIDFKNYKGLKLKKDGSYSATSKVMTEKDIEEKLEIVINKIEGFIKSIENDKYYDINPLKGKNLDSCKYCMNQDICYKNDKDYKFID